MLVLSRKILLFNCLIRNIFSFHSSITFNHQFHKLCITYLLDFYSFHNKCLDIFWFLFISANIMPNLLEEYFRADFILELQREKLQKKAEIFKVCRFLFLCKKSGRKQLKSSSSQKTVKKQLDWKELLCFEISRHSQNKPRVGEFFFKKFFFFDKILFTVFTGKQFSKFQTILSMVGGRFEDALLQHDERMVMVKLLDLNLNLILDLLSGLTTSILT